MLSGLNHCRALYISQSKKFRYYIYIILRVVCECNGYAHVYRIKDEEFLFSIFTDIAREERIIYIYKLHTLYKCFLYFAVFFNIL